MTAPFGNARDRYHIMGPAIPASAGCAGLPGGPKLYSPQISRRRGSGGSICGIGSSISAPAASLRLAWLDRQRGVELGVFVAARLIQLALGQAVGTAQVGTAQVVDAQVS